MESVILAGGLGTRLNSKIQDIPKAMAPVAGQPFIDLLLNQLADQGCKGFMISVGHLKKVIMSHLGDEYKGIPIRYAEEETPLGTGGAIRLALESIQGAYALVLNGDTFLETDYRAMLAFHRLSGRSMTMAVTLVPDTFRYGGVIVNHGHVEGFIEKGQTGSGLINAGAYILNRDFAWSSELDTRFSFETDVLVPNIGDLQPAAFQVHGRFLDIGVPADLDRAQIELPAVVKNHLWR